MVDLDKVSSVEWKELIQPESREGAALAFYLEGFYVPPVFQTSREREFIEARHALQDFSKSGSVRVED